jgi:rod shape determining protein RodA
MIDRKQLREIDWILIGLLLVNSLVGIVLIHSSSHYLPGNFFVRQVIWVLVSVAILFLTISIDYKVLLAYSPYILGLFTLVLFGLLVFGRSIAGAKSWVRLAFIGGQPSELAKIAVLLVLARVFSEFRRPYLTTGFAALGAAAVFVPVGLVALQPDLGTAVTYLPRLFACFLLAGLRKKTFIIFFILILVVGLAGWNFLLKDYQKKRLTTLINPGQDPRGSGYHILQSKIAIGSGGLFGKGYKKGSQSQLKFLPARHTDFIVSVLGEEFGFAGVLFVFSSYFLFLFRIIKTVPKSRDRPGMYIIFMVASMIAFQFLVNVMMIVGLLPIAGIPIPLLSYGGSSILTTFVAVGLVLNVKMRRFANV